MAGSAAGPMQAAAMHKNKTSRWRAALPGSPFINSASSLSIRLGTPAAATRPQPAEPVRRDGGHLRIFVQHGPNEHGQRPVKLQRVCHQGTDHCEPRRCVPPFLITPRKRGDLSRIAFKHRIQQEHPLGTKGTAQTGERFQKHRDHRFTVASINLRNPGGGNEHFLRALALQPFHERGESLAGGGTERPERPPRGESHLKDRIGQPPDEPRDEQFGDISRSIGTRPPPLRAAPDHCFPPENRPSAQNIVGLQVASFIRFPEKPKRFRGMEGDPRIAVPNGVNQRLDGRGKITARVWKRVRVAQGEGRP